MVNVQRLIEFISDAFPPNETDEELVNSDTMHGYALAEWIAHRLKGGAYGTVDFIPEDWGWYCFITDRDYSLAYGVQSYDRSNEFMINFSPMKGTIRQFPNLFKKRDISADLAGLQQAVFDVLNSPDSSGTPRWLEA